jgi:hypothetical protein
MPMMPRPPAPITTTRLCSSQVRDTLDRAVAREARNRRAIRPARARCHRPRRSSAHATPARGRQSLPDSGPPPMIRPDWQTCSRPLRQSSHSRQPTQGYTITRSPGFTSRHRGTDRRDFAVDLVAEHHALCERQRASPALHRGRTCPPAGARRSGTRRRSACAPAPGYRPARASGHSVAASGCDRAGCIGVGFHRDIPSVRVMVQQLGKPPSGPTRSCRCDRSERETPAAVRLQAEQPDARMLPGRRT